MLPIKMYAIFNFQIFDNFFCKRILAKSYTWCSAKCICWRVGGNKVSAHFPAKSLVHILHMHGSNNDSGLACYTTCISNKIQFQTANSSVFIKSYLIRHSIRKPFSKHSHVGFKVQNNSACTTGYPSCYGAGCGYISMSSRSNFKNKSNV